MQNPDQRENIDQYMNPANDNADVVLHNLDKEHYISAEKTFSDNQDDYTIPQLETFNKSAEAQIIGKSQQKFPDKDLSEEEAEYGMKTAENAAFINYGSKTKPGLAEVERKIDIIKENENILNDLDELIDEASKEGKKGKIGKVIAFPLPGIGAIYSILKGRKMKKKLERLQGNLSLLKDIDGKLKQIGNESTLKPDKISPDEGHIENISGSIAATVGYSVIGATSPIGLGLTIGGSAVGIYGLYKLIKSWQNVSDTQESLEEFKKAVNNAREKSSAQKENLQEYEAAYIQGARENIQTNFPGTLAD